jgi:hypothetical protein
MEEVFMCLLEGLKTTETLKGIDRIIPVAFWRWRKNVFSIYVWCEFFAMRKAFQAATYDFVLKNASTD